jgi:hypothetical protein
MALEVISSESIQLWPRDLNVLLYLMDGAGVDHAWPCRARAEHAKRHAVHRGGEIDLVALWATEARSLERFLATPGTRWPFSDARTIEQSFVWSEAGLLEERSAVDPEAAVRALAWWSDTQLHEFALGRATRCADRLGQEVGAFADRKARSVRVAVAWLTCDEWTVDAMTTGVFLVSSRFREDPYRLWSTISGELG